MIIGQKLSEPLHLQNVLLILVLRSDKMTLDLHVVLCIVLFRDCNGNYIKSKQYRYCLVPPSQPEVHDVRDIFSSRLTSLSSADNLPSSVVLFLFATLPSLFLPFWELALAAFRL